MRRLSGAALLKGKITKQQRTAIIKTCPFSGDLWQVGMNTGTTFRVFKDVDPERYHLRVTSKEQGKLRVREELQLRCGNSVSIGWTSTCQMALVQVQVCQCLFESLWTGFIQRLEMFSKCLKNDQFRSCEFRLVWWNWCCAECAQHLARSRFQCPLGIYIRSVYNLVCFADIHILHE